MPVFMRNAQLADKVLMRPAKQAIRFPQDVRFEDTKAQQPEPCKPTSTQATGPRMICESIEPKSIHMMVLT
jgi:hypothetical protein